jgi:hypothetical protein
VAPAFEVWESPGGLVWEGNDQEEAILTGLRRHRKGVFVEVAEIYDIFGRQRPRRIAYFDGRPTVEAIGPDSTE